MNEIAAKPLKGRARAERTLSPQPPISHLPEPAIEQPFSAKTAEFIEAVTSPAIESDFHQAGHAMLAATREGTQVMATVESNIGMEADKAQATFGDMSARLKTAFEKSNKVGEEMVDFAKGNVEAIVASARVAAKHGETLGQEAADYGKKSLEQTMAMFRGMAGVKSPTELFQLQSEYAKSSFDSIVAEVSKLSESMMKIAGDVAQPLSSRYAVAAEKIKTVAL